MAFPIGSRPLPGWRFPFHAEADLLPKVRTRRPNVTKMATRLPLSPYCNPLSAGYSLGVFHRSPIQLLASFADKVSGAIAVWSLATNRDACLPFPAYPRKAGYSAHSTRFCAPQCRFIPASYAVFGSQRLRNSRRTIAGLHGNRVGYSMPLECARDP